LDLSNFRPVFFPVGFGGHKLQYATL
jgi:hypothetical protein